MKDIPVVIMCGGQGTRMGSTLTKKELIDIGGRPLLWHVMRIFSAYGHNRFILALGHQGDQVRRYFLEYEAMTRDATIHLAQPDNADGRPRLTFEGEYDHPPWDVTLVDTGLDTGRAARLLRLRPYLGDGRFFVAYGEAVADIDLDKLLAFHQGHGRLATISGIRFPSQYGKILAEEDGRVTVFEEKPLLPYWINGGFMVFETAVLDIIQSYGRDDLMETNIMPDLMAQDQLMLYKHTGYWQSMKTFKDAKTLNEAWQANQPWNVWGTMNGMDLD
ncbi:MAG TPA: glucose-1-phosphate cytidylyltransferase [Anaerolineae bacterium]|nr:glucose-1-phosphate cytidylyltransferase [Anaerolineae bacterium]